MIYLFMNQMRKGNRNANNRITTNRRSEIRKIDKSIANSAGDTAKVLTAKQKKGKESVAGSPDEIITSTALIHDF